MLAGESPPSNTRGLHANRAKGSARGGPGVLATPSKKGHGTEDLASGSAEAIPDCCHHRPSISRERKATVPASATSDESNLHRSPGRMSQGNGRPRASWLPQPNAPIFVRCASVSCMRAQMSRTTRWSRFRRENPRNDNRTGPAIQGVPRETTAPRKQRRDLVQKNVLMDYPGIRPYGQ